MPEQTLWRAVLLQAVFDATTDEPEHIKVRANRDIYVHGLKRGRRKNRDVRKNEASEYERSFHLREKARRWLLDNNPDFRAICAVAGVDARHALQKAAQLCKQGWKREWPEVSEMTKERKILNARRLTF